MKALLRTRSTPACLAGVMAALVLLHGPRLEAGEALSPALTVLCGAGARPAAPVVEPVSRAFTARSAAGDAPTTPSHAACSREFTLRSAAGSTPASSLHLAISQAFTLNNPLDVAGVPPPGPGEPPLRYGLSPGFPNPFQSTTVVRFELPERARVRLQIFDVMGRLVRVLLRDVELEPGRHDAAWDGLDGGGLRVSGGRYYCVLNAGRFRESRSLLLMK